MLNRHVLIPMLAASHNGFCSATRIMTLSIQSYKLLYVRCSRCTRCPHMPQTASSNASSASSRGLPRSRLCCNLTTASRTSRMYGSNVSHQELAAALMSQSCTHCIDPFACCSGAPGDPHPMSREVSLHSSDTLPSHGTRPSDTTPMPP